MHRFVENVDFAVQDRRLQHSFPVIIPEHLYTKAVGKKQKILNNT